MSRFLLLPPSREMAVVEVRDACSASALASVITMLRDAANEQERHVVVVDYDQMLAQLGNDEREREFVLDCLARSLASASFGAVVVTVTGDRRVATRLRMTATAALWIDLAPNELLDPWADEEPALVACDVRNAVGDRWRPFATWAEL